MAVMPGSVAAPRRSGGRSRSRNQDRDGEADRRGGGDPQTRPGIADAVAGGPEEQERRDRLDGEEIADDEERDRRVAARPDPDPDDRRPEPDQRRDRQRPRDTDEMARQSQRQVRLEQEDHPGHLVDRPRDAGDELGHDRDREQGDHGCEDQHQVAMDRPWVPQVVDEDHDEDQDECRLQSDIDGVHESLGTAPRGWDRIDRTLLAGTGAYTADVRPSSTSATLREHDRVLQPHNRSMAFDGIGSRPDGGVQSQAPGSHLVGPKRAMDRIPHHGSNLFLSA